VPRYRETARTQRSRMNERFGTMKREQSARTSVDPPSGIARLICPITLNNPRDNSIAWYPGTVREVAQLSANFLQFVNVNSRSPDIHALHVSRREISGFVGQTSPRIYRVQRRRSLAMLLTNEHVVPFLKQRKKRKKLATQ